MKKDKAPKTSEGQVENPAAGTPVTETIKEEALPTKPKSKTFLFITLLIFFLILLVTGLILFVSGIFNKGGGGVVVPTDNVTPSVAPTTEIAPSVSVTPSITPTSTITPTPDSFSATVLVNTATTALCDFTFIFTGKIHSPVAGDIEYSWERSDTVIGIVHTLHFDEPGTQDTLPISWASPISYSGWAKIRITSPTGMVSNIVNVNKTCNHTGLWYTNFGTMNLVQTGLNAAVDFEDDLMGGTGSFTGTFLGAELTGTYSGQPVVLDFSDARNTVNGIWNHGIWCGAKSGSNFDPNCSFAGKWSEYLSGSFFHSELCQPGNQTLTLTRNNNTVSGTYCNGTITGTLQYDWVGHAAYVLGTYSGNLGAHGDFGLYLLNGDYTFKTLSGNYNDSDFSWCAWRAGESQPGTCLYPVP